MVELIEILAQQKNIIVPVLLTGSRRDKKRLFKIAKVADVIQIVLPVYEAGRDWPDFSVPAVLDTCAAFRRKNSKPLILQASAQHALSFGPRSFFADFVQAGVNAFIFPNLPPEESNDFLYLAEQNQTILIFSAADCASAARMSGLLQISPQIIVSITARTGQENIETERLLDTVNRLKKKNNLGPELKTTPLVFIAHDIQQEDNLRKAYQNSDGLLLQNLLNLPERDVVRAVQKLRKLLIKG